MREPCQKICRYGKTDGSYQQIAQANVAIHACTDTHPFPFADEIGMAAPRAFHGNVQAFQPFCRVAELAPCTRKQLIDIRKNHILSEILVFIIPDIGVIYVIFLSMLFSYKRKF